MCMVVKEEGGWLLWLPVTENDTMRRPVSRNITVIFESGLLQSSGF